MGEKLERLGFASDGKFVKKRDGRFCRVDDAEAKIEQLESDLQRVTEDGDAIWDLIKAGAVTICPDCGPGVPVDEDGLCMMCGADAMVYCYRGEELAELECPSCAALQARIDRAGEIVGNLRAETDDCVIIKQMPGVKSAGTIYRLGQVLADIESALSPDGGRQGRRLLARVDGWIEKCHINNIFEASRGQLRIYDNKNWDDDKPITVEVYERADEGEG